MNARFEIVYSCRNCDFRRGCAVGRVDHYWMIPLLHLILASLCLRASVVNNFSGADLTGA